MRTKLSLIQILINIYYTYNLVICSIKASSPSLELSKVR
jgi:hypothetical protein